MHTPRTKLVAIDTLLPETDGERQKLRMLSFVLLGCGIFGFIRAVATYGLGYFLATFYFVIIWITILHSASAQAVLANSCCFALHKAFAKLRLCYVIGALGTTVGVLFSIGGIIVHSPREKPAWAPLAVIALISGLIAFLISIMAHAAHQIQLAIEPVLSPIAEKDGASGCVPQIVHHVPLGEKEDPSEANSHHHVVDIDPAVASVAKPSSDVCDAEYPAGPPPAYYPQWQEDGKPKPDTFDFPATATTTC